MFCKNCGAQLADDALFCEECGTKSNNVANEEEVNTPKEETTAAPEETTVIPEETAAPAPKKSKKGLFAVIGAVVIVAVAVIIALSMAGGTLQSNFDHQVNFNNGGQFAYDDSRLYFVANYNEDDSDTSLYSTDYKGLNKKLIASNGDIVRIRVIDGKIYYETCYDEGKYAICVMNTDGSGDKTIVNPTDASYEYDVVKNNLYYLDDSKIHVCTTDGENDRVIIENADYSFAIDNGMLYYNYDNLIYKFDLKKETATELCKAEDIGDLAVAGDTLYFTSSTGLCSVNLNGDATVTKVIRDEMLRSYVVFGDYIYYNHEMTSDEVAELAYAAAEGDTDLAYDYLMLLLLTGDIYRADKTGGAGIDCDAEQAYVYTLYTCPENIYCKHTIFDTDIEPVEFIY